MKSFLGSCGVLKLINTKHIPIYPGSGSKFIEFKISNGTLVVLFILVAVYVKERNVNARCNYIVFLGTLFPSES